MAALILVGPAPVHYALAAAPPAALQLVQAGPKGAPGRGAGQGELPPKRSLAIPNRCHPIVRKEGA